MTGRLLALVGEQPTLARHHAAFGTLPERPDLAKLLTDAGLRGRGGGGFPAGAKLAAVAAQPGRKAVVVNAAEGEPLSRKDRALLRVAPHLVLDGAQAVAAALRTRTIVVAVSRPAPELVAAIAERGLDVEVRRVPDRFVSGEETALLRALAGKPALPTTKPPYPFEQGLGGAPTLVQNAETLAHTALIARYGADWFGAGTALVTLSGAVANPGVHEIPLGTTLAEALDSCGGLDGAVAAYLVGGYFGGWVAAAESATFRLTPDTLGAGAIVALPASTCAAAECARVVRYLAEQSAGQCGPCIHGLAAMADAAATDARGDRRAELSRLAGLVRGRGACRHPDGAARFVETALDVLAEEFARHARHRGCGRPLRGVLPVESRRAAA